MTEIIGNIGGVEITRIVNVYGEIVHFVSDADEDNDGLDSDPSDGINNNPEHDPYHQNDTTLHGPDGRPLDAYKVPFVVVPPLVCQRTRGIVLGSECLLTNKSNGKQTLCVVGDIGPKSKTGEISPEAARRIDAHITAFNGDERRIYDHEIHVGKPAVIDGVRYPLKPFHG